jgi:hypothetical protein
MLNWPSARLPELWYTSWRAYTTPMFVSLLSTYFAMVTYWYSAGLREWRYATVAPNRRSWNAAGSLPPRNCDVTRRTCREVRGASPAIFLRSLWSGHFLMLRNTWRSTAHSLVFAGSKRMGSWKMMLRLAFHVSTALINFVRPWTQPRFLSRSVKRNNLSCHHRHFYVEDRSGKSFENSSTGQLSAWALLYCEEYYILGITPCSLLRVNRRFRGTCHLHLQGRRIIQERNQC